MVVVYILTLLWHYLFNSLPRASKVIYKNILHLIHLGLYIPLHICASTSTYCAFIAYSLVILRVKVAKPACIIQV